MTVTFELPPALEADLRRLYSDVDREARELFLVELFRREVVSHFELSQLLGMTRYETDGVLKKHMVTEHLSTPEELREEMESLGRLSRAT